MTQQNALQIAVVGAGPSGFYVADALARSDRNVHVDMIERLPTPYGLIRAGVAPDHQTTKAIQQTFAATALLDNVRFVGNVEVGRDIGLDDLRGLYDAVVLASGVADDTPLGIPGADLPGVYGAAQFVGWYNGHPDFAALAPDLAVYGAVIIGNGNVALDVARILAKSSEELVDSDIACHAAKQLERSTLRDIHVVGRRGPVEAKFTNVELRELGTLSQAVAMADASQIPDDAGTDLSPRDRRLKVKNLECLRAFAETDGKTARQRIHFRFGARPVEILGADHVEAVRFEHMDLSGSDPQRTGSFFDVPCGLVVASIGYRAHGLGGLPVNQIGTALVNDTGLVTEGLYVTGWLRRGPSGKIATNRLDGDEIAARILSEVPPLGREGSGGLDQLLSARGISWTSFEHWQRIEAAEIAAATPRSPRRKMTVISEMLALRDANGTV